MNFLLFFLTNRRPDNRTNRFINTIKYIKMAASSNFGNVFSVLGKYYRVQSMQPWFIENCMQPLQPGCHMSQCCRCNCSSRTCFMISLKLRFLGQLIISSQLTCQSALTWRGLELYRDNVDPEYLAAPKVWNAKSIARFMIFMGPTSSVFDMCVFLTNWYGILSYIFVRCLLTKGP